MTGCAGSSRASGDDTPPDQPAEFSDPSQEGRPSGADSHKPRESTEEITRNDGSTPGAGRPRTRTHQQKIFDRVVDRLTSNPATARDAFRQLSKMPADLIPVFLPAVASTRATKVYAMDVYVVHGEDETVMRSIDEDGRFYYYVRGMGRFSFEDIALGEFRRGTRVRFRNIREGFPLGAVVCAALLNRFKSPHYPNFEDKDLLRWWEEYYRRSKDSIR